MAIMMISSTSSVPIWMKSAPPQAALTGGGSFAQAMANTGTTEPIVAPKTHSDAVLSRIDVAGLLTDDDKAVLGWPSEDPCMNFAAAMLAMDRRDGLMHGPLTSDHIVGNDTKNIPGLAQRFPVGAITDRQMRDMLGRLESRIDQRR